MHDTTRRPAPAVITKVCLHSRGGTHTLNTLDVFSFVDEARKITHEQGVERALQAAENLRARWRTTFDGIAAHEPLTIAVY